MYKFTGWPVIICKNINALCVIILIPLRRHLVAWALGLTLRLFAAAIDISGVVFRAAQQACDEKEAKGK